MTNHRRWTGTLIHRSKDASLSHLHNNFVPFVLGYLIHGFANESFPINHGASSVEKIDIGTIALLRNF